MLVNPENKYYIYHHPEVKKSYILLSRYSKLLELWAFTQGMDKISDNLGGIGINSGERDGLIIMGVAGLTLIFNMLVDRQANLRVPVNRTIDILER